MIRRVVLPGALAALVLAGLLGMGSWQLRRHAERNAGHAEALAVAGMPVVTALAEAPPLWRRVALPGRWVGAPALVAGRTHGASPGYGVLQAYQVDGGPLLPVDRGFVPHDGVAATLAALPEVPLVGQARPLPRVHHAAPLPSQQTAAEVFPPGATADAALRVAPEAGWYVVAGAPLPPEAGNPPTGGAEALPIDGYQEIPWDPTSRSYALQWFGMAALWSVGAGVGLVRRIRG